MNSEITAKFFAIALIAAGQSSTITGTLAGQIVMEGYLKLRINPWARRLLTRMLAIIPALLVIILTGEKNVDSLLVLSQVILSMQLGFAIIPLIHFVSDKRTMGKFAISNLSKLFSWIIASILIFLNIKMLVEGSVPIFHDGPLWQRLLIGGFGLGFAILLIYTTVYPIYTKNKKKVSIRLHPKIETLPVLEPPVYSNIVIALDFTSNDDKLLSAALGQGHTNTKYTIVHVVESASAKLLGKDSDDFETTKDKEQLQFYVEHLLGKGLQVTGKIGYRNRKKEIVRLAKEVNADLLVMGSHGHKGLKDLWFGETVNSVRHQLKIPVLVVNV